MADAGLLLDLVSRYGYALVFLLGVGEALPLVGILVPGHATLLLAGVAAAAGLLDVRLVIAVAFAAGIVGDAIGFWLSRRHGQAFLDRHGAKLRIRPAHVARSNAVFERYGPFALVVVRFSFVARGMGPFLAGLSAMRWRTFWLYNVVGAVLWSVANALGGYFFGLAFLEAQALFGRVLASTLLAAAGIYALYRVLRRFAPAFTRLDLAVAVAGAGAAALFGAIADRAGRPGLDDPLDRHADALQAALAPLAPLAPATHASVLGLAALALAAGLLARRRRWEAALVTVGVGGALALALGLHPLFTGLPQGAGFPSARAAASTALAGVAAYLVAERARRVGPALAATGAGLLLVAAASAADLARGGALPTSVAAGLALGAAWLCVSLLLVEFGIKRPRPKSP